MGKREKLSNNTVPMKAFADLKGGSGVGMAFQSFV